MGLGRLNPIAPNQRAYVSSHPLGVWLSLGIMVSGLIDILFPHLTQESSSSIVLSPEVRFAFNMAWVGGGAFGVFGLLRGRPKIEGAGMSLLAAGMLSLFVVVVSLKPTAAITALFILAMGLGCAFRAKHLAHSGYLNLDIPDRLPTEEER